MGDHNPHIGDVNTCRVAGAYEMKGMNDNGGKTPNLFVQNQLREVHRLMVFVYLFKYTWKDYI